MNIDNLALASDEGDERLWDEAVFAALGASPLHVACSEGDLAEVERLLAAGANVNARSESGATPLSYAQARRDSEIGETLLFAGADPSLLSHHDWEWLRPLISKVACHWVERGVPKKRRRDAPPPGSSEL